MTNNNMQDIIQISIAHLRIANQRIAGKDYLSAINAIEAAVAPLHDVHSGLSSAELKVEAPSLSSSAAPDQPMLYDTAVAYD